MKKPERNPKFFEEFAKRNHMKPFCKVVDEDADILLADSNYAFTNQDGEYVYRTGYAINRSGLELGWYHDYPFLAFPSETQRGAQQARINDALAHARRTIAQTKAAGFYDANRKHEFSSDLH